MEFEDYISSCAPATLRNTSSYDPNMSGMCYMPFSSGCSVTKFVYFSVPWEKQGKFREIHYEIRGYIHFALFYNES